MEISIAITTYNRSDMTLASFVSVLNNQHVKEIVIVDDHSNIDTFLKLRRHIVELNNNKIRLIRNEKNLGMAQNKYKAISESFHDWVIILDSDNTITDSYIDAIVKENERYELVPDVIYCPDWAMPEFDYRAYVNLMLNSRGINPYLDDAPMKCLLNTCNYLVHKPTYIDIYEPNETVAESDTIWFNYLWLKAGKYMKVVKNMSYNHRVHDQSGWLLNADYNSQKGEEIRQLIKNLSS